MVDAVQKAIAVLKAGGVVGLPTETVYGLAADITQPAAIEKIYAIKGRPKNHPIIIHISDTDTLFELATHIPAYVMPLVHCFWPGPLTLLLKKAPGVNENITGGHDTVGVRFPAHPMAQAVICGLGHPVAAPSANRFGALSPTTAEHVVDALGDSVDFVLDGGRCPVGIESTIVDATHRDYCTVVRHGMILAEDIREVVDVPVRDTAPESVAAPGNLKRHYCPKKPVTLISRGEACLARGSSMLDPYGIYWLSFDTMPHDPKAYAYQLYFQLRLADASEAQCIKIELPPNTPEWRGILERLYKMVG
jgi:L-threonylcarbamoyladenylate synthase